MMRNYIQSPLPFQGQKRNFLKQLKDGLQEFDNSTIFVDLFGGSGLLSHCIKQQRPDARVIYNDYDNFSERLKNVDKTNVLLADIREILGDYGRKALIKEPVRGKIIDCIKKADDEGFVDYITLSASLLFSGKYKTNFKDFIKDTFYNRIKLNDYSVDGYLEGVEIVHYDYRLLFSIYRHFPDVVFLIDPPYLSTDCSSYKNYWKLKDYLDVLLLLKDTSYFYFTSDKSSIVELCDWLEHNLNAPSPFFGATKREVVNGVNKDSRYTDIMMYKAA
ncbi:MAG: DNA adenine methylase [Bacteroidales bacterium]